MKRPSCSALAELRSAYVDGALDDDDREALLNHLVACDLCRHEVDELRAVRALLHQTGAESQPSGAPENLSSRLVSIAGRDAHAPLWSRPFRRTRPGKLPRSRRSIRIRATAAAVVAGSVVATSAGIGYAAAPPAEPTVIADPSSGARAEFSSVLAQLPLANGAVNAVMMASDQDLTSDQAAASKASLKTARGTTPIDASEAAAALQRAAAASTSVGYSGVQQVLAPRADGTISAQVRIAFMPGQGSQLSVHSASGKRVVEAFVPTPATSRVVNGELLSILASTYVLSGSRGSQMAGRAATVVEATVPDQAGVSARWWIDDKSGVLLWHETYDSAGALIQASGFTSVSIGTSNVFVDHLAPRLAVPTTTASLTLSSAGELTSRGWFCQQELAGLPLIRLRTDAAGDPGVLQMVYSDALSTVSVVETRGALDEPAGFHRDATMGAFVRSGVLTMATWQSGDTVFTVTTDGPNSLLGQAVASLPHQAPHSRTMMERVRAGWTRIFDLVIG